MNPVERERKCSKNSRFVYPAAHNGLVAGSSPAGPTSKSITYQVFISPPVGAPHQKKTLFFHLLLFFNGNQTTAPRPI